MRVEPNRRCGVRGSGSTVRADGRDSGSAPRFSAILRSMRATPTHIAPLATRCQSKCFRTKGDGGLPISPQAIFLLAFSHGQSSSGNASKTTGSRRGPRHGASRQIRIGDRCGPAKEKAEFDLRLPWFGLAESWFDGSFSIPNQRANGLRFPLACSTKALSISPFWQCAISPFQWRVSEQRHFSHFPFCA